MKSLPEFRGRIGPLPEDLKPFSRLARRMLGRLCVSWDTKAAEWTRITGKVDVDNDFFYLDVVPNSVDYAGLYALYTAEFGEDEDSDELYRYCIKWIARHSS